MRKFRANVAGWKSPTQLEKNPSLWGRYGVRPQGAHQGKLGDCWFIAAASAVAEYPNRIKNVFINNDFTKSGIF